MTEMSAVQSTTSGQTTYPYPASWFDRFSDRVDRLSISSGLFYASLAAILVLIQLVIEWMGSNGTLYAFPLAYIATIPYALALMHFLDKVAAQALETFRPLMSVDESDYRALLYRLTTLPTKPTLIAAFLGAVNAVVLLVWIPDAVKTTELHITNTALSLYFNYGITFIIWAIVGVLVYHTLHQLQVVWQIYHACSSIDLYKLRPLYAFSTLSAWTAIGIAFMVYVWYFFAPLLFNIGAAGLLFFTGLSLLTFVLPLWGARRLLVDEKEKQLGENRARQKSITDELHRRVDAFDIANIDHLSKAMTTLDAEYAVLDRISTWPWKPETARTVTAALLFPMTLWLIQLVLKRIFEV